MNVTVGTIQYKVKDISLADFGRQEIEIAEKKCLVSWQSARNIMC